MPSLVTGRQVTAQEAFVPSEAHDWFTHRVELLHDPYCSDLRMEPTRHGGPAIGDKIRTCYLVPAIAIKHMATKAAKTNCPLNEVISPRIAA